KTLPTFIIFQIIYTVVQVSANNYMGEDTTVDLNFVLAPRFTLWFLLSLFCWNVLLFLFAKFRWWTVLVAFAVGISISFKIGRASCRERLEMLVIGGLFR